MVKEDEAAGIFGMLVILKKDKPTAL